MQICVQTVITAAAFATAVGVIIAGVVKIVHFFDSQKEQDREIEKIKRENTLICYGLSACLDGLIQLGANHNVPVAKDKLDKYLNQQAHN